MRFAKPICFGLIAIVALSCPARSQDDPDQSLRLYAVHVIRVPKENWTGQGVYLGNGLVLTAGHVAGAFWNTVRVEIAGQELSTEVLKRGSLSDADLALVSIDDSKLPVSLRLRRMPICQKPPWPGEQVIVAIPEGIAQSHVISPALLPRDIAPKFRTAISDVATTGNSGSGVFDARMKCLLGIISAKISASQDEHDNGQTLKKTRDIAKSFVPGPVIAQFIPPQYRFWRSDRMLERDSALPTSRSLALLHLKAAAKLKLPAPKFQASARRQTLRRVPAVILSKSPSG
jgi:S1-C subfamily serine protease